MHGHHHFLHFLKNRELNELYATIGIKSFALAVISIFIPIFLLQLGYTLLDVFVFTLFIALTHALAVFPAGKLSAKYGFKHSIMISVPFLIISYLMLFSLQTYNWPIILIAILTGISNSFFWIGYHTDFAKSSKKKDRKKQVGFSQIVLLFFTAIGPVTGGFIAAVFGFPILFAFASLLMIFSIVPLVMSEDKHIEINFSISKIFSKKKLRDAVSFIGFGVDHGSINVLWPIIVFLVLLNSVTNLGILASLSLLFSTIVTIVISFRKINTRHLLRVSGLANAVIWALKAAIVTPFNVFILDALHGTTKNASNVTFTIMSYNKANKTNIVEYTIFREFFINIGWTLLFLILIIIPEITTGFISGTFGSILVAIF